MLLYHKDDKFPPVNSGGLIEAFSDVRYNAPQVARSLASFRR